MEKWEIVLDISVSYKLIAILQKYGMIELEKKTFLPKAFDYLLCAEGQSFDDKGDQVMSHGGMTIDEVIVPFITLKAVNNNG